MFGPNATYELGRVWSWQKSVAPDKNARDKGWLLYIFLCKNWIRCHFLIRVFFWWGNGGMVRCNWTIYCFCTVNLTSEVIFFFNETVMAASSSSSFKSVRSSPFMRPFWSCLESRAKFLKVQSALPRFGSVLWLVYIPPPPPPISADVLWGGLRDESKEWRLRGRLSHWWLDAPLVTSVKCVYVPKLNFQAALRLGSIRRPWPKTTAILRCWTQFWQFLSICHLPNHGKRKVAANKLKLGKWKIYWWKIFIDR